MPRLVYHQAVSIVSSGLTFRPETHVEKFYTFTLVRGNRRSQSGCSTSWPIRQSGTAEQISKDFAPKQFLEHLEEGN